MTAIILLKEPETNSFFHALRRIFTKPKWETRSLPDSSFSYLFCEVELPRKAGRHEYTKLLRRLIAVLDERRCSQVCICGAGGEKLRKDLASYGFEAPTSEPLKRIIFDKLLDFTMERLMTKPCERAALVDYDGNFHSEPLLYSLCKKFRYVTLITANAPYFEEAERHIMETMGLAIQVTSAGEEIEGCGVYVLASGGERSLYHYSKNRENVVICMSEDIHTSFIGLRSIVCRPLVTLSPEIMSCFPEDLTDTRAAELMAADGVSNIGEMVEIIGAN